MGSDFTGFNNLLPEFNNANRERCFIIPIVEDTIYEEDEDFQAQIALASDSPVTVNPLAAIIRIIDTDGIYVVIYLCLLIILSTLLLQVLLLV